jgi:hypothetical protein
MKIHSNNDINNINEESRNALRNFRQNQINSNIKLHKLFLGLVFIINIGLLGFIFFYKSKISEIKKLSKRHASDIDSKDTLLVNQRTELGHKMANIAALGTAGMLRFSLIFEKSEEFHTVKKLIYDYRIELGDKVPTYENFGMFFLYQGIVDSDDASSFMDYISYIEGIIILIQTEEGKKFGIYHKEMIAPDENKEYRSESKNVIIFSLDTKKIYKFNGKKYSISFTEDKVLSLGKDELVINNEYFSNGGYIEFPLKSFDFSSVNSNVLTEGNGKFNIRNLEVYCLYEMGE